MDYDKLLNMATELGFQLMSSGAEIYRAEESVYRLLRAYGLEEPQVFAIPNALIVSMTTPQGHPITRMRRIPSHGTNIELLERCNDLCRQLCFHPLPLDEAQKAISGLSEGVRTYRRRLVVLGHGVAAACFGPLFGACLRDCVASCFCGLLIGMLQLFGRRLLGSNSFFRTAICSAVASLLVVLLVRLGIGHNADKMTISVLMLLVPGAALTNAMREIMAGDIMSGLSRMAEVILLASAIALGVIVGLWLGQLL